MKIEFLVDYEILQKKGFKIQKDLCLNKDGLLTVKEIKLDELSRGFDGEAILGSVVNSIINIKYRLEKENRVIFYCNFVEVRYYPISDDAFIEIAKLDIPDNNLFDLYQKYKDIFQKIGFIIANLL